WLYSHLARSVTHSRKMIQYVLFFFSSRRRHTRLVSDWSSDVCSSDLAFTKTPQLDWREGRRRRAWELKAAGWKQQDIAAALGVRSEERRVGKEGRARWSPEQ